MQDAVNDNFNSEEFMRDAQKDAAAIAAVREEFSKNKPPSLSYRQDTNLIDEAPLFSQDIDFDSTDHTLIAQFGNPSKFIYKNKKASLTVSVSLPKGITLEDPDHVYETILKLYKRVKYYQTYSSE